MKDAPGEPVELGDHERGAFPCIFKRGLKLRSLGQGGDLFGKNLLAASRLQGCYLCLKASLLIDRA